MISLFEPREPSLVADGCAAAAGQAGGDLIRRVTTQAGRAFLVLRETPNSRRH